MKYSAVIPVYRVEKYLDQLLESIVQQSIGFEAYIQLVLVDDGSDDNSSSICTEWAKKYPHNIVNLRKDNGGVVSAINHGIGYAEGEWVTFFGADDFLDRDYFREVDNALAEQKGNEPCLINCSTIFFFESTQEYLDSHPLAYRFKNGVRIADFDRGPRPEFHLSVATSFFKLDLVKTFGRIPDVRPNFEDANFIARYLLARHDRKVLIVPGARYYYRKREDRSSALDRVASDPRRYSDLLKYGYLKLLSDAKKQVGSVPAWIQRLIIYDLGWQVAQFIDNHAAIHLVPVKLRPGYHKLLKEIFSYVDTRHIAQFEFTHVSVLLKTGVIKLYKNEGVLYQDGKITGVDRDNNLYRLNYLFTEKEGPGLDLFNNGGLLSPACSKVRVHKFMGHDFVYEKIVWLPWKSKGILSGRVQDHEVPVIRAGGDTLDKDMFLEPPNSLTQKIQTGKLTSELQDIVRLSRAPESRDKYHKAWLLMDRAHLADDNAEHFYRYLMRQALPVNAWFVLDKDSPDWARLVDEGFHMIPYGSLEHAKALIHAEHVVSSHAEDGIPSIFREEELTRQLVFRFTFLGHGVTQHDVSDYLNHQPIDNLICSSQSEADLISQDYNTYNYSQKEVVVTGMPRYDKLLQCADRKNNYVLIMPTWRKNSRELDQFTQVARETDTDVMFTVFYRAWVSLLEDRRFVEKAEHCGYRILFMLHPLYSSKIKYFNVEGVETIISKEGSIQDYLSRAAFLVTDYSSIAFDMAYINRPTVYYQFDEESFFGGSHVSTKEFDYDEQGFGPVCREHNEVIREVTSLIQDDGAPQPVYKERMERFFPYRDGRCCERVYRSIAGMNG